MFDFGIALRPWAFAKAKKSPASAGLPGRMD
jgi:hypothetical protein